MARASRFLVLAVTVAAALSACGGDGGSGPTAADVDRVVVTPGSSTLTFVGETVTLTAAGEANGSALSGLTFTWSSSNQSAATVSAAGVVTAAGAGTATITASVDGGTATGTATITVAQAIAAVVVDPVAGDVAVGSTLQIAATAQDQGGAPIASPSLTWTSSNESVATVDGSGLVTGVEAGTATITATGGGVSDDAAVSVFRENFTPSADQTISGLIKADVVTIPAGVTVTASSNLTLDALGDIRIEGDLVGDCVGVSILGGADIVVEGQVSNACSDVAATGAPLSILGFGEMMLDGARIQASGDLELGNDRSFDESAFEPLTAGATTSSAKARTGALRQGTAHPCDPGGLEPGICFTIRNGTTVYQGNVQGGAGPAPAKDGDDGAEPTDGEDGRTVKLLVQGDARFAGTTTIWGQDGGRGGDATVTGNTDVEGTGANGGVGGNIRVLVTGKLEFEVNPNPPEGESPSNTIRSGAGGRGGDATVTAEKNGGFGPKGPSATATGGDAGGPGLIQVQALGGVEVVGSGLTMQIGALKRGGNAVANGAPGEDAVSESTPAQEGGDATARGGAGASGPDKALTRSGAATGTPVIPDNPGGAGGTATAVPGEGGDGIQANKPGADGGDATGNGGTGGDQLLRNIDGGPRIGNGGNGGDVFFVGAMGGAGWSDCREGQAVESGGRGGNGGNTLSASTRGMGGAGLAMGDGGSATYDSFGNGGAGGDGVPVGEGGTKGADGSPVAPKNGLPTSFQDGPDGTPCGGETETVEVVGSLAGVPDGALGAGDYGFPLVGTTSGETEAYGVVSLPEGGFKQQLPVARFGLGPGQSLGLRVSGLETPSGAEGRLDVVDLCFVNDEASPSNPAMIEVRDAEGAVLFEDSYTGPVSAAPGAIDEQPAANCKRYTRTSFANMAVVFVYGLSTGFLDLRVAQVAWLLVLIVLSS